MKNSFLVKGETVHIEAMGKSYEYSLEKDATFFVEGPLGKTQIEIKDHKVRIIDSPCPNKTCIARGWSNPIVCLPNQVIITLENKGGLDAIAE